MKNPLLAKNPFLSMWMQSANSIAGAAWGHVLNNARQQQAIATREASRAIAEFWSGHVPAKRSRKLRSRSR
jgi:hypothetical protein